MSYKVVTGKLAAQVNNGATFTVAYPKGTDAGTFFGATSHEVGIGNTVYKVPDGFALAFGTSNITVTNNTGAALPAGTDYGITLDIAGTLMNTIKRSAGAQMVWVTIGAPDAADPDGICETQTPLAAGELTLDGVTVPATSAAAVLDVPRGVSVTSGGVDTARVFTITGLDDYDQPMTETITGVNAGTVLGKKAFKKVTSVSVDAATAGAITVGTTDVLGLPFYLDDGDFVLREMEDGTVRTNGTFVPGVLTTPSATTGDVRGTYDPNAACNGALVFRLLIASLQPAFKGRTQYSA